jgi:hypothetical protein
MNAYRDALAHKFIATVLDETASWAPALQVSLHELAFDGLPELVLELDAEAAVQWVRRWRVRMEQLVAEPVPQIADEDAAWIAELALEWQAGRAPAAAEATPAQIARLAELFTRLGPLALALPWRGDPHAKA